MLDKVTNLVSGVGKAIDDNTESGEERQAQLTRRLEIDMVSDNWLSKSIRPLTLLILLLFELIIVVAGAMGNTIDAAITIQVGTLLGAAIGFYFDSKKRERIAEKNAKANMELERINRKAEAEKTKAQIKENRREARHKRRMERKEGAGS